MTHLRTVSTLAATLAVATLLALLASTPAVAEEEDPCKPETQSAECCQERGGAWMEEEGSGYCFEKLPSEKCTLELLPVEDTELCIRPVIDWVDPEAGGGEGGPRRPRLVTAVHLAFPVEAVELEVGRQAARQASAVELPPGWHAQVERGGRLVASGPPTTGPFLVGFDLGDAEPPAEIGYSATAGGRTVVRREGYAPPTLPPATTAGSLSGVVLLPPVVAPGETVQAVVRDPAQAPPGGTWSIGGTVIGPEEADAGEDGEMTVRLPDDLQPGDRLAVRYVDAFGRVLLDVAAAPGVSVVPALSGPAGASGPAVTGGSRHAGAGGEACVCGSFPGPRAWDGLRLEGEPLGEEVAASQRAVSFAVPADLAPGPYTVTGDPAAGFTEEDRWTLRVVTVGAELNQQQLLSGGSTALHLRVHGTDEPLTLRLVNRTPQIVRLEGGDEQQVTTSGGQINRAQRTLTALTRGAFDVGWELVGEPCPCSEEGAGGGGGARLTVRPPLVGPPPSAVPDRLAMAEGVCEELAAPAGDTQRRAALEPWRPLCEGEGGGNLRVYGYQCVGSDYGSVAASCATTWLEQWLNDLPSCEHLPAFAMWCYALGGRYSQWVQPYSLF